MKPGPTIGVLLAAGASARMGSPKALLRDRQGRTFLARLVRTLLGGGCETVIVVAGRHVREIAAALPSSGALLAYNARWETGQLSSARVGLRTALSLGAGRVVLHLVDQPLVRASDVSRVLGGLGAGDLAVASHRGEPGHPVALGARACRRALALRGASLRDVLDRAAPRRTEVAGCSPGCVKGANTKSELRALWRPQGKTKPTTTGE